MERIGLEAVFLTADFQRGILTYQRGIATAERLTLGFTRSTGDSFGVMQGAIIGVSAAITSHLIGALNQLARNMTHALSTGVGEAADLEQQISGIRSVISITDEQAEVLRDTMFDIALDPTIQADIFDVADAMDIAARAGARFDEIVGGLTRSILVLANATAGDYKRAADILTSATIVWGLETQQIEQAVNDITAAVNSSKLSLDDYRFSMSNAGGVANLVGASFRDFNFIMAAAVPAFSGGRRAGQGFASFLAQTIPISKRQTQAFEQLGLITFDLQKAFQVLRTAGIQPVGNSMSDIVPQLYELATQTGFVTKKGEAGAKQFQEWAKQIGLFDNILYDANGNLQDANRLIQILRNSVAGLNNEQINKLFTSAFGREGVDFAAALANVSPERLAELNLEFARTDAADIAAMRMDNLRGALEQLQDTIHAMSTQIGLEMLPALTDMTRIITAFLASHAGELQAFFVNLGSAAKTFTEAIMAGTSPLEAFTGAMSEFLFAAGYGRESVETLRDVILELASIVQNTLATAMAFAAQHAIALQGALNGVLVALGVAVAIGTLTAALNLLFNPIAQLIALSAALGAAWATDFGGMRTAVLWFVDAIQPALNQVVALGIYVIQSIQQLASDFAAGWSSMAGDANTGVGQIGQAMFQLGIIAHQWGVGLVNALSEGIMAAVGAVITAVNYLGSILAYFMAPGSPPRFLPDLDKWGTGAAEAYLEGWTEADFDALSNFGNDIKQILQNLVGTGALDEEDANPILLALRDQMASALEELNRTGAVSEATFAEIRAAAGAAGEEVEGFARQYVALTAAMEAANAASEKLTAAQDEQTEAQRALDDIKDRILAGDKTVTMDDYRAAQARLSAARAAVTVAEDEKEMTDSNQKAAQKEFNLFKARMGIQNETLSIMAQQAALLERLARVGEEAKKRAEKELTALEKQLKFHEMFQAHYNDRIRLAELDLILADEKATATEKASAEIEKQLILARMAQREFEASELGFDLSGVYDLPIVFADAEEKLKKLKGSKAGGTGVDGLAAAMGGLPGLAADFAGAMEGAAGPLSFASLQTLKLKQQFETLKGVFDNAFGFFGDDERKQLPFLTELKEFLALLQKPIKPPTFDFESLKPPQEFLDFMSLLKDPEQSVSTDFLERFRVFVDDVTRLRDAVMGGFGEVWKTLWEGTQDEGVNNILGQVGGLARLFETLAEVTEPLRESLEKLWPVLKTILTGLGVLLLAGSGAWFSVMVGLVSGAIALVTALVEIADGLIRFIANIIEVAWNLGQIIVEIFRGNQKRVAEIWETMHTNAEEAWQGLVDAVTAVIGGFISTIYATLDGFVQTFIAFFMAIYNALVGESIIPDLVNEIITWFTTLDDRLWEIITQMWEDLWTEFETAKTNLLTTVQNLINEIVRKFTDTDWGKLGRDLVTNIANGIVNNLGRIGQAARDLVARLISAAISAITGYTGGGQSPTYNDPGVNSGGGLPNNAAGTNYWRGGATWVGEQGAELISSMNRMFLAQRPTVLDLPRGSQILDATATRNLLSRPSVFGTSAPVTNTTTIHNTRNYYVSTSSTPMQIDRALAVASVLND